MAHQYNNLPIEKTLQILTGYVSQFSSTTADHNFVLNSSELIIAIDRNCWDKKYKIDEVVRKIGGDLNDAQKQALRDAIVKLRKELRNRSLRDVNSKAVSVIDLGKNEKNPTMQGNILGAIKSMIPNAEYNDKLYIRSKLHEHFTRQS